MRIRLKENPREWQKFTVSVAVLIAFIAWLMRKREWLPVPLWSAWTVSVAMVLICFVRPHWFRKFYRGGMTAGFLFGQTVGRVLLVVLFLFLLTPTGLLLRLFGKDLLRLKRRDDRATYWIPAKRNTDLDRQF